MSFWLILILSVTVVSAEIPINGTCPDFDCCKDTNYTLTLNNTNGDWYLYGGALFYVDKVTKCTKYNFRIVSESQSLVNVNQHDLNSNKDRNFTAKVTFDLEGNVVYSMHDIFNTNFEAIFASDDYILLIQCSECGYYSKLDSGLHIYIITKERLPSVKVIEEIYDKLKQCGIPRDLIEKHDQSCKPPVGC